MVQPFRFQVGIRAHVKVGAEVRANALSTENFRDHIETLTKLHKCWVSVERFLALTALKKIQKYEQYKHEFIFDLNNKKTLGMENGWWNFRSE